MTYEIIDAHTHFFSYTWLEHFVSLSQGKFEDNDALANFLQWQAPPKDPAELGKKWIAEQDKHGVHRQILFASKPGDAEFLSAAVDANSDRLTGYFMLDPNETTARNHALYAFEILNMRGVMLFPAMHHFQANADFLYPIYEEALTASAIVFVHFGLLNIPIFQKIGIPDNIDLSFSNPLALKQVALDFPDLNFIIPHFGCGRFEEALQLASEFQNIYFDTSSSNTWIQDPLSLREVFEKSLSVLGAERILFGTDSSFFPRGWRKEIFETQLNTLEQLHISESEKKAIFGGNVKRLLQL